MSSRQLDCEFCGHTFASSRTSCPHRARPQLFPNVSNAASPREKEKLDEWFSEAKSRYDAEDRGDEFARFYMAVARSHEQCNRGWPAIRSRKSHLVRYHSQGGTELTTRPRAHELRGSVTMTTQSHLDGCIVVPFLNEYQGCYRMGCLK